MDRIRSLAMQVLERHKEKFTADFAQNKKLLEQLAIVRSKGLKNEMAGYITKFIKRENDSKAQKEESVEEGQIDQVEAQGQETANKSMQQEILVESASEESA